MARVGPAGALAPSMVGLWTRCRVIDKDHQIQIPNWAPCGRILV